MIVFFSFRFWLSYYGADNYQKPQVQNVRKIGEENFDLICLELKSKWMEKVENWSNLLILSDRWIWINQSIGPNRGDLLSAFGSLLA